MAHPSDPWNSGDPYEYFMGRWSRLMAPRFLTWLNAPAKGTWLDLGCGTGALSEAIYRDCYPETLSGIDPSPGFLQKARDKVGGDADFTQGSAEHIPKPNRTFEMVVSGLALNFFPDLALALSEIKRVLKPRGIFAAYVWDYAGRMDFLRLFWDAAGELNPAARQLDEGARFGICDEGRLAGQLQNAGFAGIQTALLDIDTVFGGFDDYWMPFLGGQGPAPAYVAALNEEERTQLKNTVQNRLPIQSDGSIRLLARAIAVKGVNGPDR